MYSVLIIPAAQRTNHQAPVSQFCPNCATRINEMERRLPVKYAAASFSSIRRNSATASANDGTGHSMQYNLTLTEWHGKHLKHLDQYVSSVD